MGLIKKISKVGNSYGVILPSDVMALLGIEPESEVEITIQGDGLLIHPALKEDRAVMESFSRFMKNYPETLKKLAQ